MKTVLLLIFLAGSLGAVTKEVVRVFQPLSLHYTDSATEFGPEGKLLQAEVVALPMVLSGAFPEDLVKAVGEPHKFQTNNPDYDVPEVNLLVLCGLRLEVDCEASQLEIVLDCSKMQTPDFLEIEISTVIEMTLESLRRTLRLYYRDGGHEGFACHVTLSGLPEDAGELKKLERSFTVGVLPDAEEDLTEEDPAAPVAKKEQAEEEQEGEEPAKEEPVR